MNENNAITNYRELDLVSLQAHGLENLWHTQQAYETQIIALAKAREEYGDSVIAYYKSLSDEYVKAKDQIKHVTTAKKIAEQASQIQYAKMVKSEQKKKIIQGFVEATRERLQTIKIILRLDMADMPGMGGRSGGG